MKKSMIRFAGMIMVLAVFFACMLPAQAEPEESTKPANQGQATVFSDVVEICPDCGKEIRTVIKYYADGTVRRQTEEVWMECNILDILAMPDEWQDSAANIIFQGTLAADGEVISTWCFMLPEIPEELFEYFK